MLVILIRGEIKYISQVDCPEKHSGNFQSFGILPVYSEQIDCFT